MAALPEKLAEVLRGEIRYDAGVAFIRPSQNGNCKSGHGWQVGFSRGEKITAEHLILAVPAHVAGQLLANSVPQLAVHLSAIEYAPICTVSSVYDRSKVANPLDGFGFMVPRREGLQTICTFWNSSLFPQRAPEGKVLMTSFAGRGVCDEVESMPDEECARIVEAENARALGISGGALDRMVWKDPRALPQYNVGHARRVAEISGILRTVPNLHVAGNFLKGRSIGDCVEIACRVAEDLHSHIQGNDI
jgi:oxygen-dependent protoporphyrinogen oxidase